MNHLSKMLAYRNALNGKNNQDTFLRTTFHTEGEKKGMGDNFRKCETFCVMRLCIYTTFMATSLPKIGNELDVVAFHMSE